MAIVFRMLRSFVGQDAGRGWAAGGGSATSFHRAEGGRGHSELRLWSLSLLSLFRHRPDRDAAHSLP